MTLNDFEYFQIIRDMALKDKNAVYLVGGFLRDYCTGVAKFDYDFAVQKDALKFARAFSKKIKGVYVLLDDEHGCARIAKKKAGRIYTFDFAALRAKTFPKDLQHRDFTINTLSIDLTKADFSKELREIIYDQEGGLKDLKSRSVRMVNPKAFVEDPLRILRAFSLRAQLDFKIDRPTMVRVKKDKNLLKNVSYERIRDEIFKILSSPIAGQILCEMDKVGVLEIVIPQVKGMYDCKQGGYHHLDVWPHSLEVVCQLDGVFKECRQDQDVEEYLKEKIGGERHRGALLKLGALLHDIGKPPTKKDEGNGKFSFHGHEHVGKNIVRTIARMLRISTDERRALEDMVRWHLRPGYLGDSPKPTPRAVYRYFRDAKDESVGILLLSIADQRSTRGPMTSEKDQKQHEKVCKELISQYFIESKQEPVVRLIDGNDLIKKLRLKPSPLFGRILAEIQEQQTLGKLKTQKDALALAKVIVAKESKKGKD